MNNEQYNVYKLKKNVDF